jgi:predicted ATPase
MKKSIEIFNVGPIKEVKIELNSINVFMGAQSSGKSTIAKIISFCSWVEKDVATNQSLSKYLDDKNYFIKKLQSFHKLKDYFNEKSIIKFESNIVKFEYSNDDFKIDWVNKYDYKRVKISYIPSERNIVLLPEIKKVEFQPNYIRSFLFDWYDAGNQFSEDKKLSLLNLGFEYYKSNSGEDLIKGKEHNISLNNASSGLQSLTPLISMVDYIVEFKDDDNTSLEFLDLKTTSIFTLFNELVQDPFFNKFQKDFHKKQLAEEEKYALILENKFIKIRDNLFNTNSSNLIIEEPEQNLFPETQKALVYYLLNKCKDKHELTLTTHSPFILYALNNCMMSYLVKDKLDKDDFNQLNCTKSSVNPKDISIYQIEDGKVICIQQEDGLIGENYFDTKMKEIMDEFYVMLNYY